MNCTKKVFLVALSTFLSLASFAKTDDTRQQPQQPLSFIENKEQVTDQYRKTRTDIDYKLSAPGINIFIGDGQLHYQWAKQDAAGKDDMQPVNVTTYRMDVTLLGANRNAEVIATEIQKDKETYYFPGIGKDGVTASLYRKVTYKNVYPAIDWVLYSDGSGLKYDFVVHAGGDAKNIKLQFAGATSLSINNGSVTAATPFGSITEQAPYSYNAETKEMVASKFVLNGNVLSFDVANTNWGLVIDPSIAWATYYGGSLNDGIGGLAITANADIVFVGNASSTSNIATTGSFQQTFTGTTNGYLAKFNPNGQRLWATYFGGNRYSGFSAIAIDKYGNMYAGGSADTGMNALMTPGVYQTVCTDVIQGDGMMAKFDPNGQRIWASYYGGDRHDFIQDVAVDTAGNLYISGFNQASFGLGTPGTYMPVVPGGSYDFENAFLAKISSTGQRIWGTYFAGDYQVSAPHMCTDKQGGVYIVTGSLSTQYVASVGAYQVSNGGARDGIIARFNASNGTLAWSTYYGGNGDDGANDIIADDNGNIYVLGSVSSTNTFAASPGCHQSTPGGSADGFLAKFNNSGQRIWSTYYGGAGTDLFGSLCFDNTGNILGIGQTSSSNNISTPGSIYPTSTGMGQAFFKFNQNGQRLYGSYLKYGLYGIAADAYGNTYISGQTNIAGLSTAGSHQPTITGAIDGILMKLGPDTAVNINQPYTDTLFCPSSTFNVNYTVTGGFNTGNVFTVQLSDAVGSFASPVDIGTVAATTSGSVPCAFAIATPLGTGYRIRIVASNPAYTSIDNGVDIHIKSSVAPTVGVTANPTGANAGPWKTVTFIANPAGGGTAPTYQWRKNGVDIPGATADVYTAVLQQDLVTGDVITVKMISNETCALPDSAVSSPVTVTVNTSVKNAEGSTIKVYPNPTNGLLHITGSIETMEVSIVNMTGQVVYIQHLAAGTQQRTLNIDGAIPNGVYILTLKTGGLTETFRLSVQR